MQTIANDTQAAGNHGADHYHQFIQRINDRFHLIDGPLFQTDAAGLYEAYLASFPAGADRQYHTCTCCRQFIERFGAVVHVNDNGELVPAFWNTADVPLQYLEAISAMSKIVKGSNITMPFLSSERAYGTPVTGAWHHFAVVPPAARVYKASPLKNAFQAASEKREDMATVVHALQEYNQTTVATALTLLKAETLPNSQAVLGQAQFLADLHAARTSVKGGHAGRRQNLTWRAVALAPAGFCHPRSSMIATLLDDIAAGKSFDQAKAAWTAKMHPLQYQRPQAAPTAGAIAAAEQAFAKLGAASALKRRYATLDDILEKLWEPKPPAKPAAAGGIFGSVKPKDEPAPAMSMRAPAITITWDKFQRTVLQTADTIEIYTPAVRQAFVALTTAVDPDALPILQWDRAERRNPVALYLWHEGSFPAQFSLAQSQFHKVNAVTLRPSMWFGGGFDHQPAGAIFIIDGARETKTGAGNALFPSTLKSELHGMRAVIESYSKGQELEGREQGSACGITIGKESGGVHLRVTTDGQVSEYKIDRWD
jgi:hypothetical protein